MTRLPDDEKEAASEPVKQDQQKVVVIPRCISKEEMLNSISDRLDYIIGLMTKK
jgi:hypothetical protein